MTERECTNQEVEDRPSKPLLNHPSRLIQHSHSLLQHWDFNVCVRRAYVCMKKKKVGNEREEKEDVRNRETESESGT